MKSRKALKRLAIVLFIALCGFFYTFKAGESPEPVIVIEEDTGPPSIEKGPPAPVKETPVKEAPDTAASVSEAPDTDGIVNINTAGISELCTLTGIGEKKAERIISYRKEHGNFSSIEEIMNISGIKEGTFNKIKDRIMV
ncbi:MAG: helix-hairpin-helix domain-containing protein [Lachnospiraceae bacterium]|nr:helix-hairpin-helix domain-containing protein [Lachnospiraceae bacterium]